MKYNLIKIKSKKQWIDNLAAGVRHGSEEIEKPNPYQTYTDLGFFGLSG